MEQVYTSIPMIIAAVAVVVLVMIGKKIVLRYRWKEHEVLLSLGKNLDDDCEDPTKN